MTRSLFPIAWVQSRHPAPTDFRKSGGTRTFSTILNEGITDAQAQQFLRGITFSSKKMDPAKGTIGRKLSVQVFDHQGTPSGRLVTSILAKEEIVR